MSNHSKRKGMADLFMYQISSAVKLGDLFSILTREKSFVMPINSFFPVQMGTHGGTTSS